MDAAASGPQNGAGANLCGRRVISTELSECMAVARLVTTIPKIRAFRTPPGDLLCQRSPPASARRVEIAPIDWPYRASAGTHHATGYAPGNEDKLLTTARRHDAAYFKTT